MYQSIPSLTIPPGKPLQNFWKGKFPTPQAQRKCGTPSPRAENHAKTPSPGDYFQKFSKKNNTKHEIEIMKNITTEMLICLEILRKWNI